MSDDLHWLDRLLEAQTRGVQALELRVREVGRTVDAVAKRAREAARSHDDATEQRAGRSVVDHDRVVHLVRSGRIEELSSREARYASILFEVFTAKEILPLLRARPRGWRHLITRCMREWERFARSSGRGEYTALLRQSPSDALRVRVGLDAATLLGREGVDRVARTLQRLADGRSLADALADAGFSWRWELTARLVEQWFLDRRTAWGATVPTVMEIEELRSILLPPLRNENDSRVRSTLDVRSRTVAALVEDGVAGRLPAALFDAITTRLLQSTFGDPRIPPLSEGWSAVRELQHEAYARFLERLVREDIRIFFEHAMLDSTRKDFWLRYTSSIQRTLCVLGPEKYAELKSRLHGTELRGAIERSAQFTRRTDVHAFCLYMERIVVVEFSESGNAAFVYARDWFESNVEPKVRGAGVGLPRDLKRSDASVEQIFHFAGWQRKTRDILSGRGIHPAARHA